MSDKSRKGIGGPRTAEGKRKSSLNALKHGLYAVSPHGLEQVADLIGRTYEDVLKELRACYRPLDAVEETLVRRIARCSWRILMSETMEDHLINRRGFKPRVSVSRERLMRCERLTDIQLHRAIEALQKRRDVIQRNCRNGLPPDPLARAAHARRNPEFLPPEIAFAGSRESAGEEPHA